MVADCAATVARDVLVVVGNDEVVYAAEVDNKHIQDDVDSSREEDNDGVDHSGHEPKVGSDSDEDSREEVVDMDSAVVVDGEDMDYDDAGEVVEHVGCVGNVEYAGLVVAALLP